MSIKKSFKTSRPPCLIGVNSPLPELGRAATALAVVESFKCPEAEKEELFKQIVKAWAAQAKNGPGL